MWLQESFIPSVLPNFWYGPVTNFNESGVLGTQVRKNRKIFRVRKSNIKKAFLGTGSYVEPFEMMFEYNNGYVADHETAWLVGSPRLRQLRIRKGNINYNLILLLLRVAWLVQLQGHCFPLQGRQFDAGSTEI